MRSSQIDQLEKQLWSEKIADLCKLESYKRQFMHLCDEMRTERESQLLFILDSIERETKEGFYDLVISEQCNQLECDWKKFKQRLSQNLELVDIGIIRLTEFGKEFSNLRNQIEQKSFQNEYAQLNDESTIIFTEFNSIISNKMNLANNSQFDEEKNILMQIVSLKSEMEALRAKWLDKSAVEVLLGTSVNATDNGVFLNELLKATMTQKFEELSNLLDGVELKNRLKLENNLTQLKQNYSARINELNFLLENEVNFLSHGKIVTHKQYVKSIDTLKEILEKLDNVNTEMKQTLLKFENDFETSANNLNVSTDAVANDNSTISGGAQIKRILSLAKDKIGKYDLNGLLVEKSLKQSILANLTNKNLEHRAKQLINDAEAETASLFSKYDELNENLLFRLEKTRLNIMHDLENLDLIIKDENLLKKPNLFEDILNDMLNNKKIFEDFDVIVKNLGKFVFLIVP